MPAILLNLLKSPKLLGGVAVLVVVGALGAHHWWVVQQRDRLEAQNTALTANLETARANVSRLEGALETERQAAATATAERNEARRTLETFRSGRESDPESQEWAAQPVPDGERTRLCAALPEMDGCQNTPETN